MSELRESALATEIRSVHPYGFRSGEWGTITGIFRYEGRDCYRIKWPQREPKPDLETIDYWPLEDASDQREFR